MRGSVHLSASGRYRKLLLAGIITIISTAAAVLMERTDFVQSPNESLYDLGYRLRPPVAGRVAPIVIVAVDDGSLQALATQEHPFGWPWPRQFWGFAIRYLEKCGATAVGVDLLFTEPSTYNHDFEDDLELARAVDEAKIPVVLGTRVFDGGALSPFVPPVRKSPLFGAVNLVDGATARDYLVNVGHMPSIALQVSRSLKYPVPAWGNSTFRLQYYGHHENAKGITTYPYVPALDVFQAAMPLSDHPPAHPLDPSIFKGKIVLFGSTAAGVFDLKSSPLDREYPGVEIHATAIEDLIRGEHVQVMSVGPIALVTALGAAFAAIGTLAPKRTWRKLMFGGLVLAVLLGCVAMLFVREQIIWLPPVGPLMAVFFSVVLGLSLSYFAEDRQARFFLRALGQYVSPHVAAELKSHPDKLAISTEIGVLTVMFSDIASFTGISEDLGERVGPLLNFYLDEMTAPILAEDGTVDKYIGDGIMCFWNAPVPQEDHAVRACRAALAMQRRLKEIHPRIVELGAEQLFTRIGINTGTCTYGNMGSRAKFNYSMIGDPCNFASRLEGANKIYHTSILIGEATRNLVLDRFVLRKVDVLRVKGKQKPVAIYELMGEGLPEPATADLINKYELAFAHYCRSEWDEAGKLIREILESFPEDGPSLEMASRIEAFQRGPKLEFWDGVFVAREK